MEHGDANLWQDDCKMTVHQDDIFNSNVQGIATEGCDSMANCVKMMGKTLGYKDIFSGDFLISVRLAVNIKTLF